jgi:hypothetical protein
LRFGIWDFADCTVFLQKMFIFFEEKGIYLGEDIVKQSFVYLFSDYVLVRRQQRATERNQ